jgi:hypothetical protein
MTRPAVTAVVLSLLALPLAAAETVVDVATDAALAQALAAAKPGTRIRLAPGKYRPGVYVADLRGAADAPIVVEAADPKDKPRFEGGPLGIHLRDCAHVTLRNLAFRGQTGNGVNVDDGGTPDTPAHHVTLEGLDVSDVGPRGNRDAIKVSGVDDLVVRDCTITGWAGQGIDLVGCHRTLIERCAFRGRDGFDQGIAVQAKGGSADVTIRACEFVDVGQRGINLGGHTGAKYFRPAGATYEARNVTVEGCRFVGGVVPVSYVGVDGAVVRYNTIVRPEKWVARILQENTGEPMTPSRNGRFERNLVVYRRASVATAVNVGPKTAPDTFTFRDNFWYCEDRPASRPDLPTREPGGVYGVDPKLATSKDGVPGAPAESSAKAYGADALPADGKR